MPEHQVNERSIERDIEVPASRQETWRALTDPEQVDKWLADEAEFDLRPGGDLEVRTNGEIREGFFEEISEPSRLVFWWGEPGGELARVQIDLEEVGDGTRVHVVEARPMVTVDTFAVGTDADFGGAAPQMSASLSMVA